MNKTMILIMLIFAVRVISQSVNIRGIVTDTGGKPIYNAYVKLDNIKVSDTTKLDGSFTLSNIVGTIYLDNLAANIQKVSIKNGIVKISIGNPSHVEVIAYNMHGMIVFKINKLLSAGNHCMTLPCVASGVYLYKVKIGNKEFYLKGVSPGKSSGTTLFYEERSSLLSLPKKSNNATAIKDIITVNKNGYLNYRENIMKLDTNGINIKLIVCTDTVQDIDGNIYQAVKIGNQVWTVENLRTTKYNDGTPIPFDSIIIYNDPSVNITTDMFCYYDKMTDVDSIHKYGALYNWYVVKTGKLSPPGWHVPTESEWTTLQTYLISNKYNWDGTTSGNKIAKVLAAKTDWDSSAIAGTPGNAPSKNNTTGFSALPGGWLAGGGFVDKGKQGAWWMSTMVDMSDIDNHTISNDCEYTNAYYAMGFCGFSIRLLRN